MVLKIRLQRFGQKKLPFYHIVCINARTARNSKPLEKLGTYDPIPKDGTKNINLDFGRTKYWLGVGAQPTDTAARLLEMVDLYTRKPSTKRIPHQSDSLEMIEEGSETMGTGSA